MDKTGFFKQISTNITYKRWSLCIHGNCLKWRLVILYGLQYYGVHTMTVTVITRRGEQGLQSQILKKIDNS